MINYEVRKLKEVAQIIMGQSPPGETYNEEGRGLPFYQGTADFTSKYPKRRMYCTAPTRLAYPGDILLSVRAPIGRINIAAEKCAIGRGLAIIRAYSQEEQVYLEFALKAKTREWDAYESEGSVFGNIRKKDLENLTIIWPSKNIRKAIAHILGTLDDKIELNRQMNETLEEMAKAIFKSWFVDFDPVIDNALKAGNPIPDALAEKAARRRAILEKQEKEYPSLSILPPEIARLFPDSFEDSPLGPVPRGWGVEKTGQILELAYGKSLKEEMRQPGNIPVYGSNGQVGWHNQALVDGPGIVVGRKGHPGTVKFVLTSFYPIDTTFYVIPKGPIKSFFYLYYALYFQDLKSLAADSAVPGLNRNVVYMNHMLVPPSELLLLFDKVIESIFRKIKSNEEQNYFLATIRDTLLPKLISGQIRIKDAEKFLEGI